MKRWTLPTILMLFAGVALAQKMPVKPAPNPDNGVLGTQLIAWSEMQKPQPMPQQPQPVPPPDSRSGQQPEAQSQTQQEQSPTPNGQQPEPAPSQTAQTVTGTILKAAGKYVLQTADSTAYILDDQDKVKSYEGKRVKVTGTLDRPTGIMHVSSIELLS